MSNFLRLAPDPTRDLVLERVIDVPVNLVWRAWTEPEHVRQWFTPRPWTVSSCEIDLRPGGIFKTVMRSPEGEDFPTVGCYLDIVPYERIIWTDALLPGFRPAENPFLTAVISLEGRGNRTRYTATAMHVDTATRDRHAELGFFDGWGKALDQLIVHARMI